MKLALPILCVTSIGSLLLAACSAPGARPPSAPASTTPTCEYLVTLADPATKLVEVEARFQGLATAPEELVLTLPEGFAFVKLPEPLLDGPVRAIAANGRELELARTSPYAWTLKRDGADDVTLAWRVPMRFHDVPEIAERDAFEYPYVADDHAFLATAALLITPRLETPPRSLVRFVAPQDWSVVCPWPRTQDGWYAPESHGDLANDLIGLGNWSTRAVDAGGMRIEVAFAPGQDALEKLAGPAIEKIVQAEVLLFGRKPRDRYLFLFIAPKPVQGFWFAGSPKSGSMTLQVCGDTTQPMALEMLSHLVAHEFHHTWATAGCALPDELRFVNEGFTDWFAHQVPARLGLVTWERFAALLGEKLDAYARSASAAGASLADAGGPKFFEGGPAYTAVYSGGLIVAALLDLELRRAGKADGLDGFQRRFVNDERWWGRESGPKLDDFLAQVEAETSKAVRERIEHCLRAPTGFDAVAELVASGASITSSESPRSLRANFDGARITAIDTTSEAYALGLRDGDELLAVNAIEVFDAAAIQRAWRAPLEEGVVVEIERNGEKLELRAKPQPAPKLTQVDPTPWRR